MPDIIQRLRAGASLSVEAYDRSNTKLLATGTLGALDSQISTTTGTLNLRAMFAGIAAVGDDIDIRGGTRVGSILLQEMTIAGE